MSCRHSLANGTCTECYPSNPFGRSQADRITPTWHGDSLDGPGAVPVEHAVALPARPIASDVPITFDVVSELLDAGLITAAQAWDALADDAAAGRLDAVAAVRLAIVERVARLNAAQR